MAEVYAAINTLQERVLTAQNNVKRGLANIAAWGDRPLHNRKENPDKMELLAVAERHPRFVRRYFKVQATLRKKRGDGNYKDKLHERYKRCYL